MKSIINKLVRGQEGQTLIIVLILLLVGGLITAPLLSHMYTGLKVGKDVYEEGMLRLYAADAGVEYGLQQITTKEDGLLQDPGDTWIGNIADVNGKFVDPITVTYVNETTYGINATAIDNISGASTRIESYVSILSFENFMDNAVTSMHDVTMQPSSNVTGDVQYNGLDEDSIWKGNVDGEIYKDPIVGWPKVADLIKYYEALGKENPYDEYLDDTIDISELESIGPIYRDGDLDIINTGDTTDNITLTGTIWVTGKLTIATTRHDFLLNMNGNTIFVEDPTIDSNNYALEVGPGKPTITGSGCIIAIGNIYFAPNMATDPDNYVFIMSVLGENKYQPTSGELYGSLAGNTCVDLWPGNTINLSNPPDSLNYPGANSSNFNVIQDILQWIIYNQ